MKAFTVQEKARLIDFLKKAVHGAKSSTLKQYLTHRSVFVNGKPVSQFDHPLVPGDQVIFTVNGIRSVYAVTGHEIVTPSQTQIVAQTSNPTATLFACHPPHSASYRYVVHLALTS